MLAKFSGLNPKGPYVSLEKEKENFCVVLTYYKKRAREIGKFHVAVVQQRLRNVQTSVMHVRRFSFFCQSKRIVFLLFTASSETQGQSVGSGKNAGRKFSSNGGRAPGYRLLPNYFQKFERMPAPDWAQKMLCIIVPNRRTVSPEFFS